MVDRKARGRAYIENHRLCLVKLPHRTFAKWYAFKGDNPLERIVVDDQTQYYVEQNEDGNFCVYSPDGKKVEEYPLRREAVKEAARLNTEKKPAAEDDAEDTAEEK